MHKPHFASLEAKKSSVSRHLPREITLLPPDSSPEITPISVDLPFSLLPTIILPETSEAAIPANTASAGEYPPVICPSFIKAFIYNTPFGCLFQKEYSRKPKVFIQILLLFLK